MKRLLVIATTLPVALGFAGAAGPRAATDAGGKTPAVLTCSGKVVVKPVSYVLACADANTYFDAIRWTTWGGTSAAGSATFVQNNCAPTCAAGKFVKYPARLTFLAPKATKLGLLFSVVRYRYTVSASTGLPLTTLSSSTAPRNRVHTVKRRPKETAEPVP
jgi:hypothetical protein